MIWAQSMLKSAVVLVALAAGASGCNVIGVAAGKTLPPPRIPAAYKLSDAPTAVVVDMKSSLAGELGPMDSETVAISLERALRQRAGAKVVTEAEAAQVVRVRLTPPSIDAPMGSGFYTGAAAAHVRVTRSDGTELWPADGSEGKLVELETPPARTDNRADVRRFTLQAMGERIAALFYSREMQPDE